MNDPRLAPALDHALPGLHAFVRTQLGATLRAQESTSDVVQSVCRELLADDAGFEFRGDAALSAWLRTAALHKIQQHGRWFRAGKRAPGSTDGVAPEPAHECTPSREVAGREDMLALEHALAGLTAADRDLIVMARLHGLPHAEIAARTGRSEEACRQGLRRALVRLAAHLDQTA